MYWNISAWGIIRYAYNPPGIQGSCKTWSQKLQKIDPNFVLPAEPKQSILTKYFLHTLLLDRLKKVYMVQCISSGNELKIDKISMQSQWHKPPVRQKPISVYTISKTTLKTIEIFTKLNYLMVLACKVDLPRKTIAIINMYFNAKTNVIGILGQNVTSNVIGFLGQR